MSDASPLLQAQQAVLTELAQIGLEVARAVAREAGGAPDGLPAQASPKVGDLALAYARVSRAIRLTLMLQSRLAEAAAEQVEEEPAPERSPEYMRKLRVERIVERVVLDEHREDEDKVDALCIEAGQRLDDEDCYADLMDRPVSELVARVCRDLGLTPDWERLAEELWAREEIAEGVFVTSPTPTSPTQSVAGGGPLAAERVVEGEGRKHSRSPPPPSDVRYVSPMVPLPPPAAGEVRPP